MANCFSHAWQRQALSDYRRVMRAARPMPAVAGKIDNAKLAAARRARTAEITRLLTLPRVDISAERKAR